MPVPPKTAGAPRRTPIDRIEAEQRAGQIKALADPVRLRLLSLVLAHPDGEVRSSDLAAEVEVTGPTVSHHLGILHEARLVEREKRATEVYYRPAHDALARFASLISTTRDDRPDPPSDVGGGSVQPSHDAVLERITEQLAARFAGVFSPETVERYVDESYQMLASRAKITRFLPSLTASFATERLSALAQSRGLVATTTPEVLFVCVHNAGRSQMAAALLAQLAGNRVHVRSAGSDPSNELDPMIAQAMDEIGVPLGGEYPKPLTDEIVRAADYVITMGCGDACPVYPGKRYFDWQILDPSRRPIAEIRRIRDDIDVHVRALAADFQQSS